MASASYFSDRIPGLEPCSQRVWKNCLVFEFALAHMRGDEREAARQARLRTMVDSYFDTVWRSLRRLGIPPGAVDDGVQQVFLVAWRRMDDIEPSVERSYLLGVALRVASELRRSSRLRRELPLEDSPDKGEQMRAVAPSPDEIYEQRRRVALLASLLEEMPPKMREAFVLFELEELSAGEVARILQVPVGTVASRVRYARAFINKRLTARGAP